MAKTKHRIKVWVVTWPKGTTQEWRDESFPERPVDFFPIGAEPSNRFMYYDKKEKRTIYGSPYAVFASKDEALTYELEEGNHFTIRQGYLEVQ